MDGQASVGSLCIRKIIVAED
jgi:CheY-like chemotaxis protein